MSNCEIEYYKDFLLFMISNQEINNCSSENECQEAIIAVGGAKFLLPEWATINLETTGDNKLGFYYWTSTPIDYKIVAEPVSVFGIYKLGIVGHSDVFSNASGYVRPVIHISQSNIIEKLEAPEYVNP